MTRASNGLFAAVAVTAALAAGALVAVASPRPMVVAYLVGAIALVYVAVRWPECIFAFFLFSSFVKSAIGGVDITLVTAGLTVLGTLVRVHTAGRKRTPSAVWLFIALAAVVLAGVVGTPSLGYGLDKALRFGTLGLMTVLVVPQLLSDRASLRRFALSLAVIGTAMAATADWAGGDPRFWGRYTAFGSDTIALGRATALAIVCWVVLASRRQVRLISAIGGVGLCAWALLGSGNRAALVGVVLAGIALVVTGVVRGRKSWKAVLAVVACLAVLASVAWVAAPARSRDRYVALVQGGAQDNSSNERRLMYADAVAQFERAPVFGIGTGGFESATPVYRYPHNSLLELLAENGIVGGALYVALVAAALYLATREDWRAGGLATRFALAGVLVTLPSALASSDINGHRLLYAFIALALVLPLLPREAPAEHPSAEGTGPGVAGKETAA